MWDSINHWELGKSITQKRQLASRPPESNPEPATHEHCHIPQNCNIHRNQIHRHADSPSSEIAATRRPVSLSAQDIDDSTNSRLVSWAWVDQRHSWAPPIYERRTRATPDSTESQVHITSSSSTHRKRHQQCKPANTVQANPTQSRRTGRDPSKRPTISHFHALDNKSPPSGGHQSFFSPLSRDQPWSLATNW